MPPIARLIGMATGLALFAAPSCPADPELRLTDMTFVGSRDGLREVVVESRFARFLPEPGKAWLEDVAAEVSVANAGMSFTLYCREAEFDVDEIDFLARGGELLRHLVGSDALFHGVGALRARGRVALYRGARENGGRNGKLPRGRFSLPRERASFPPAGKRARGATPVSALRSVLLALLLCASMPASSQPASDEAAGLGLGVSLELPDGYETSGGRDIAEALLEALEMQGVGRLRLVSGDGIAAGAQRDPARIRRLASELGLSGLVVGKVTRLGNYI